MNGLPVACTKSVSQKLLCPELNLVLQHSVLNNDFRKRIFATFFSPVCLKCQVVILLFNCQQLRKKIKIKVDSIAVYLLLPIHFLNLIKSSKTAVQIIRKLNPMKRPSTPPQSATRDSNGKASSSVSIFILLDEIIKERVEIFGTGPNTGDSPSTS